MTIIGDDNELNKIHSRGSGLVYNDRSGKNRSGDRYNVLHAAWCSCIPRSNTRTPKYYFSSLPEAIQWLSSHRGPENRNWRRCSICGARPQEDEKPETAQREQMAPSWPRSRQPTTSYLDFDIEVGHGIGREYPVTVRSPAGEARRTMVFPFDELALENRLLTLQNVLLRSGGRRRLTPSQDELAVQEFGKALFNALLVDETSSLYFESRRMAHHQDAGLRVRLRLASPIMAALPWEFLYDARHGYVCLSVHTPVVRYLELPQPPQPLAVEPPLRILGLIASPSDLPDLDLERERARLQRATAQLQNDGLVELAWLQGQTWRDLQRALQRGPWHIFHFAGHGAFDPNRDEGLVMLADETRRSSPLQATQLGRLLADHRPMRLAILNACEGGRGGQLDIFSSTASILVRAGLPAVVAMQYEITDLAAIELTQAFYEALANGLPVDAALSEARKAVSLAVANSFEWGTPVLYMRAPDGVLFDLAPNPTMPRA